jgi:NAD(P)-dependent dehydrogenase (short-subunit alcohol dehydrogenase family)
MTSQPTTSTSAIYPSLANRVVIVTGGGSGIGAATAHHFSLQGARVAILDLALEPPPAPDAPNHPQPLFLRCDLTDIPALQAAIAQIHQTLGPPRVLINNAANDDRHRLADITPAYWDERMAVNLRHQFFATQAVAPLMHAAGGGSIINMSSISWMIPSKDLYVYIAAKSALIGLTRSLAHELGPQNIRVNCVLPGYISTPRQRRYWTSPEEELRIIAGQCLKRTILPEDVARLLLFLASDDSSAITNQNHIIDGGWI